MFRVCEDDMYMEIEYNYSWWGARDDIQKLADTANKIVTSPEVSVYAEDWKIEVKPTVPIAEKNDLSANSALYVTMGTFGEGIGRKDLVKDCAGGEFEYFEKIIRRIEDESGVKFED